MIASATTANKEACCKACGMNPNCVAATQQCYPDKPCVCHMHGYQEGATTAKQANSTICVTGRAPAPEDGALYHRVWTSEEEMLNYGVV